MIMRALRPDRMTLAITRWVGEVLGDSVGYGKTAVALALVAADHSGPSCAPTLVVVPPPHG